MGGITKPLVERPLGLCDLPYVRWRTRGSLGNMAACWPAVKLEKGRIRRWKRRDVIQAEMAARQTQDERGVMLRWGTHDEVPLACDVHVSPSTRLSVNAGEHELNRLRVVDQAYLYKSPAPGSFTAQGSTPAGQHRLGCSLPLNYVLCKCK